MKNIFKILILFICSFTFGDDIISYDKLVLREKVFYEIENYKPYSGKVVMINVHFDGRTNFVQKEFFLLNGIYHGEYKEWNPHGDIREMGKYINGLKDGLWVDWDEVWTVSKQFMYKNGVRGKKIKK